MYMVLDPGQFQVIVTNNLFGDIITDLGATFQGGLGMAASGNLHPGKTSMFEPVHGSAPKFAGKNIANPIGAIASVALMLETCGLADEAAAIDAAILKAVRERQVTQDVGGTLGTREAGDFIACGRAIWSSNSIRGQFTRSAEPTKSATRTCGLQRAPALSAMKAIRESRMQSTVRTMN